MNSKTILVKKALSCVLMLTLSLSSTAGMAVSNEYEHSVVDNHRDNLWMKASAWVSALLPGGIDEHPGFRWVETTPVKHDLSQLQTRQFFSAYPGDMSYQRVVAPGGMFRRFEQGPAGSLNNSLPHARGTEVKAAELNLVLQANIPSSLFVADSDITWLVQARNGGVERELHGRRLDLSVPNGIYEVLLRIDAYEERVVVDVSDGKLAAPRFATNIGRVKASSTTPASWDVFRMQGAFLMNKVLGRGESYQISGVVPVGEYDVVASINEASQHARIHVGHGEIAEASLDVPTGRVNLVATLGNTPALRPMEWKVFRLENGHRREIAAPRRHMATLVVPPGQYEAVASLDGKERHREFTVMQGTDNSVVLAMD